MLVTSSSSKHVISVTAHTHAHTLYLPHIWILKDGHYPLDALNSDALLEAAQTWRRTQGEQSCLRALIFFVLFLFLSVLTLLLVF